MHKYINFMYQHHLSIDLYLILWAKNKLNSLCLAGKGGTLGISGWGCATRTLEPLAYTRASFSWILLPYTRANSPNHSYPRVAVFQKLRSLAQSKAKPKQSLIPQSLLSEKRIYLYLSHKFFFPSSPKFQGNLIE